MKFPKTKINFSHLLIALLFCSTGVLGYLYYDLHSTNLKDKELIRLTQEENLDLSQDIEIVKDNYDKLSREIKSIKSKPVKVVYKYKTSKKKYRSAAGKNSKYKSKYSKNKVSYKKLYFQLKNHCNKSNKNYKRQSNYKKR